MRDKLFKVRTKYNEREYPYFRQHKNYCKMIRRYLLPPYHDVQLRETLDHILVFTRVQTNNGSKGAGRQMPHDREGITVKLLQPSTERQVHAVRFRWELHLLVKIQKNSAATPRHIPLFLFFQIHHQTPRGGTNF